METKRKDATAEETEIPHQEYEDSSSAEDLIYGVEDAPPWYLCLLTGLQHYLVFIGGTISMPLIISPYLCLEDTDSRRGELVSTAIFASGIVTILQTSLGIRLPIVQGTNFAYFVPTITLLTSSFPQCHTLDLTSLTEAQKEEQWQLRLREVQGAIAISSIFQVLVGFTGVVGHLMSWVTPLTIIPTVTLLGLSLFSVGAEQASSHWGISATTLILLVVVSQFLKDVKIPIPAYNTSKGFHFTWILFFTYFPLLFVMSFMWAVCGILTATDVFPEGLSARTDSSGSLVLDSPWFRIPYPGQWGRPTVSVAGVVGMAASVFASIIESIGDYFTCAKMCHSSPPPAHAINRGIGIEGIGCILAGIFGTTSGTASYTGNIILLGVTRVASRRVILTSGVLMLVTGTFGKFGAVFATIPKPVLGSTLIFMFSLITGIGLSILKFINLNSSRNLFVLGFSIFMGIALPEWLINNKGAINSGSAVFDQAVTSLLQTSMFVGGFLGLVLDNSIPGTAEERGLLQWSFYQQKPHFSAPDDSDPTISYYDLPFGMTTLLSRWEWPRRVPFFPMFEGFQKKRKPKSEPQEMIKTVSIRTLN